jgi:hypothetical protein
MVVVVVVIVVAVGAMNVPLVAVLRQDGVGLGGQLLALVHDRRSR